MATIGDYGCEAEELYAEPAGDAVFVREWNDHSDEFIVNESYFSRLVQRIPPGPNGAYHGIAEQYHYEGVGPWGDGPWEVNDIAQLMTDLAAIPLEQIDPDLDRDRLLVLVPALIDFLREAQQNNARVTVIGR
jgi:hypothetical protein